MFKINKKTRMDVAREAFENNKSENLDGVLISEENISGINITKVQITNKNGAQKLDKPIGLYYTIDIDIEKETALIRAFKKVLEDVLPKNGRVLIVGLGNAKITPDSLGTKSAEHILVNRHLKEDKNWEISAIIPGVLGTTGIETRDLILGSVKITKPDVVIAIDSLGTAEIARAGATLQVSNTGISPGAGIGNNQTQLNEETLGVPVIAVGVPLVVDLGDMIVTPKDIDIMVEISAEVIASAINHALA